MNRRLHMRNALGLVLGFAFLPWATAQQAAAGNDLPSAESILDRYVEVTGGAAAYESRTSEAATGTFEIAAAGLVGQLQVLAKPGMMRTSIELPGVGLIESGVKDDVVWAADPVAGPRLLEGFEAELTIATSRPGGAADWREVYKTVETAAIEEVNGKPAYRVVQTLSGGGSIASFYSVDSGLLSKMALGPVEQLYEAYSEFAGILTPSRIVTMSSGQRIVITVASLEANVDIPDERFNPPEAVQALLK